LIDCTAGDRVHGSLVELPKAGSGSVTNLRTFGTSIGANSSRRLREGDEATITFA
jgi:hypothetical protein